ncbi:hypothetical protein [Colwellia hornerae]|uniref:Uncharacterized protein n=1 Tax=Colwellia hornerae TaxID=89402 RepID=A0A5C6QNQ0_9GAMM|nr:hypothetical protein [Colwellia hornerae]TWX54557.1 hypothetical protein ESZ28_07510 [Colwellia hornerae]TWX60997.1 hypothetical protein ESZ26_06285 [Colwellia hornerae]TWX70250.1 hypothetical protein ESZ27_03775 [Colwellia hornerae]
MKFFNKIATLTFVTTMMVAQAQAIELVKVETVANFSITAAAQQSIADSMKLNTSTITLAKAVIDVQKTQVNVLKVKHTQSSTKSRLVAE